LYDARSFLQLVDYTQLSDGSYRSAISYIFQFHIGEGRPDLFPRNFSGVSSPHSRTA